MDSSKTKEQNTKAFAEYLRSTVTLNALEHMTSVLDQELAESQRMLTNIKSMFDSITTRVVEPATNGVSSAEPGDGAFARPDPVDNGLRHEDLSNFLEAGVPKLLMADMEESTLDVDLDAVIATMKGYAEDLKKNFVLSKELERGPRQEITSLGLEQYAQSLDQLSKRLANIKLTKSEDNRNMELEAKLMQLCQDVEMFTQIVQTKKTLSEQNKNWSGAQQDSNALYYDDIINKLLAGINEVAYLLQTKNRV